jgi:hypothetical protein
MGPGCAEWRELVARSQVAIRIVSASLSDEVPEESIPLFILLFLEVKG